MPKLQTDWIKHKIDVEKYSKENKSILQYIRELFNNTDCNVYKPIIRG